MAAADWLNGVLSQHGLWWGLPAAFLGGLALNLTPCVYPMLPVTVAFFSQQASGAARRTLLLAGCYVLGISLSYALLGLLAAQTGALFGAWLQSPLLLIWIALAIVSLALSLFGLYEIRLPAAISRRLGAASPGLWGALLMGLMVGVVAAPCVGPFLVGLMLFISRLGNPAAGFLLFFVLGVGMGVPSLVLAVASSRVGRLPKADVWLVWSKKALGVILLGLALYFLRPLLSETALTAAAVCLLAGAGAYLGWLERSRGRGAAFLRVRRVVGGALVAAALVMAWPRPQPASLVPWIPYSEAALEEAQRTHRPIVIDVYADWCIPCVEMEHVTFRHPDVAQALQPVATLRVDATRGVSADAERLLARYRIYGAPTTLFFDRSGQERTDLRLLGFAAPDEFLERLRQIL
jgi:thiol:disulfide interchange protein DsbD